MHLSGVTLILSTPQSNSEGDYYQELRIKWSASVLIRTGVNTISCYVPNFNFSFSCSTEEGERMIQNKLNALMRFFFDYFSIHHDLRLLPYLLVNKLQFSVLPEISDSTVNRNGLGDEGGSLELAGLCLNPPASFMNCEELYYHSPEYLITYHLPLLKSNENNQ